MISEKAISVYTVLSLLKNMRKDLGLEAMSEFIDSYVLAIERTNPELKEVLKDSLTERAINQFYQAVVNHEKN
jgi:hypothetical protein